MKEQLHELKTTRRKEIAGRLEHAKSLGDLSENAEYQEAKEEQSLIESEIAKLEEMIRDVVIIPKNHSRDVVQVGSTVRVKSDHSEEIYTIVGSEEADPLNGKISNESPLGKAFLGHKPGDKVEAKTPGGILVCTIEEIR